MTASWDGSWPKPDSISVAVFFGLQEGHGDWAANLVRSLCDPEMGYDATPDLTVPGNLLGQMIELDGVHWAADIVKSITEANPQVLVTLQGLSMCVAAAVAAALRCCLPLSAFLELFRSFLARLDGSCLCPVLGSPQVVAAAF